MKQYGAEFIGTFWLVLGGCGSAVLAAAFPDVGIGLLGVSPRIWSDFIDHGLRYWPYIGLSYQSGSIYRFVGRWTFSSKRVGALHYRSGAWRSGGRRCALSDRQWQGRVRCFCRFRFQWLRRAFAGWLLDAGSTDHGSRNDHDVSADYSRCHGETRTTGFCPDSDRPWTGTDSPDQHPGNQYLGEPGTQYRCCTLCRGLGSRPALDVLGGSDNRCIAGCPGLPGYR